MRQTIGALQDVIDTVKAKKAKLVREYIKECTNWLYITDHAIVRYLERSKGMTLVGDTDTDKLKDIDKNGIRKEMLSKEEQLKILLHDIEQYRKDDIAFIIKGVTVVTVINRR